MVRGYGNWIGEGSFKRFAFCAMSIVVGLGMAGVAYQTVSLFGVAVSGAETVDDLNVGWFPIRMLVAISVARVSGGWLYRLRLQRWRQKGEPGISCDHAWHK